MRDIYHVLVTHDFSKLSDKALEEARDLYGDAGMGVDCALQLIGNLLLETEESEEYSDGEARRDLSLVGTVLRHLPRMSQALGQNSSNAIYELKKRERASQ